MKTPQEIKAEELVSKYLKVESPYDDNVWGINKSMAVQCAKIAVDEIIDAVKIQTLLCTNSLTNLDTRYYQQVRLELDKL